MASERRGRVCLSPVFVANHPQLVMLLRLRMSVESEHRASDGFVEWIGTSPAFDYSSGMPLYAVGFRHKPDGDFEVKFYRID